MEVRVSAVAGPEIEVEPDRLLCGEVGMTAQGPEARDDKAAIQVFRGESILESVGNARCIQVCPFRALEPPLLFVGEELDKDEENEETGEDEIGDAEDSSLGKPGEDDKNVCWAREQAQEKRLAERDEEDVQKMESNPIIAHSRANYLPAIILRPDLEASSPPVVKRQSGAPEDAKKRNRVHRGSRKAGHTGPNREMDIANTRYETPAPIHLGIVPVHLGHDQEDARQKERERDGGDKRIGGQIDLFEVVGV